MPRIDAFLNLMIEQKASDLHLEAGNMPILRVNGELLPLKYRRICASDCMVFISEIILPYLKEQFELDNDVDFSYQIEEKARFRINLFRHKIHNLRKTSHNFTHRVAWIACFELHCSITIMLWF